MAMKNPVYNFSSHCAGLDPRIYQMACDELGVTPAESVFLDDIGANLKGARALGMTTIKVDPDGRALDELEAALGITLPR